MSNPVIGFIGGGNMARSLIGGLIHDGTDAARILAADPIAERRAELSGLFGIETHADNAAVAGAADVIVLAVKPQFVRAVAEPLAELAGPDGPLIVSIAAGVRLGALERWTAADAALVRVMPNTPALVGSGASALFANAGVSDAQRDLAESIVRSVGVAVWVENESLLDAVTALSGSGPAYFFYLMESMETAAMELGMDADTARLLILETGLGAARLALESTEDFAELRRRVTSPGGTTERALAVLQERRVGAAVVDAIGAAEQRSCELAEAFGEES